MTEAWVVQGYKEDEWKDMSTEWRDRKPSKTESLNLFKGVKEEYNSIRLIKRKENEERVLWENKGLLDQDIPIETVRD